MNLVEEMGESDLSWAMSDPRRALLPEAQLPEVFTTFLPVLAQLLIELGVARVVHDSEILRHRGRRVLAGAFGVKK